MKDKSWLRHSPVIVVIALISLLASNCKKAGVDTSYEFDRKVPSKKEVGEITRSGYLISAGFHEPTVAEPQDIGDHFYVVLNIRPADLSKMSDGTLQDPFHSSFSRDNGDERNTKSFLANEMGAYFHLEDSNGKSHQPLAYRFRSNPGMQGVYAFVFVFANLKGPISVKSGKWQAVLRDFGLGTGTIRLDLKPTGRPAGKA